MPGIPLTIIEGKIARHYGSSGERGPKIVEQGLSDSDKQTILRALSQKGLKDAYGVALDDKFSFDDEGRLFVGQQEVPEDQLRSLIVDISV
ncbi:MAG TPA: hypothetical protein DEB09_02210 [Candidatus Magasanikbacteria bacterium]|nr:hypothetical protein [Candidatus Magasanikbacteria bacterium]